MFRTSASTTRKLVDYACVSRSVCVGVCAALSALHRAPRVRHGSGMQSYAAAATLGEAVAVVERAHRALR